MKEWFSAKELAGLPGLPGTVQKVNAKASRDDWRSQERSGRGGGREYHLHSLPEQTAAHLIKHRVGAAIDERIQAAEDAAKQELAKVNLAERMTAEAERRERLEGGLVAMTLDGNTKARDLAKHAILGAFFRFEQRHSERGRKAVVEEFCRRYYSGEWDDFEPHIPVDAQRLIPEFSSSSLYRWLNKTRHGKHLGGVYGQHRRGTGIIDSQPDLARFIVAMICDKPHISRNTLYKGVLARFSDARDVAIPSSRSLQRWVSLWLTHHAELATANANPDAWKSRYMAASGSLSADIERINQRWELDSSPADVLLSDGRHALLACIDIYTRRAKLLVAKTSKAAAIALLLRRCLLDWGVPEVIKTDNGQDYVSQHIARVCALLGVRQECSAPFSPWEKGHVERFFRTFSHGVFELLPGFIGHNVTEREALRSRAEFSDRLFKKDATVELRMDVRQLQSFCDDWAENLYHRESHGGIGTTPFLRAQDAREAVSHVPDERVLDLLLAEAPSNNGLRTVNKDGIRLDGDTYDAPSLEAYRRQTVQVLYDPDDLGRIYVYAHDRPTDPLQAQPLKAGFHFVCVAECAARLGISRADVAARAAEIKQRQKARVQDEKRQLKRLARQVNTETVLDEIMAHRRAEAAQVVAFPKAKVAHHSDGIAAARDALAQADAAVQADPIRFGLAPTPEHVDEILADLKTRPTHVRPMFESPTERAMWLFEQGMAGREAAVFTGEDRIFLQDFRKNWPKPYRTVNDILTMKYEGRWEQYSALRRAVGWPEAVKPKD